MPSINNIVQLVAGRLNRPFSEFLKAEIKPLFISELALLLRRSIDANGIDTQQLRGFTVALKEVPINDIIGITSNSKVLRSVNKIPIPIRYKTPTPFVSVSTLKTETGTNIILGYVPSAQVEYVKELPYIGETMTYDYINEYLYVFNTNKISNVKIVAPIIDYSRIIDETNDGRNIPFDDDTELPYPQDLINTAILSLLQGILSNLDSKDKVTATHLDNE